MTTLLPAETRRGLLRVNLERLFVMPIALLAFPALAMEHAADDTCSRLMTVATDPHKIQYVRTWVAERTKDERFVAEVRHHPFFDHRDPTSWHFIDLDWRYLGLSPDFARLDFNGGDSSYIRTIGVRSVGLYQGRSGIIVGLSSGDLALGTWRAEEVRKLRPVADDVFVYCDD